MGTYFALSRGLDFRSVRLPIVASPFAPAAAVSAYASHVFAAAARGEPFTFPVAPEVALSVIYVRDVTLGILKLTEAPAQPLTRRVYNLHGFAASAADLAQAAARRVPGFRYRFEPAELPTRILSVQPPSTPTPARAATGPGIRNTTSPPPPTPCSPAREPAVSSGGTVDTRSIM